MTGIMVSAIWNQELVQFISCCVLLSQAVFCGSVRNRNVNMGQSGSQIPTDTAIPQRWSHFGTTSKTTKLSDAQNIINIVQKDPYLLMDSLLSYKPKDVQRRKSNFVKYKKKTKRKISKSSKSIYNVKLRSYHDNHKKLQTNAGLLHTPRKRTVPERLLKRKNNFSKTNHLLKRRGEYMRWKRNVASVNDTFRNVRSVKDTRYSNNTNRTLPIEWTAEGNYSAVVLIWKKYIHDKEIAREAQIAFMCTAFLLCLLSWAVWCTGMCNRKKVHYREWNFQCSHETCTVADVMRRRWKHLPEQSFYEEVIVHDQGTDP